MHKLGIIGTGNIAHAHIKAAKELNNVEVAAVSNRTIDKALLFAEQYGIIRGNVYADYIEMLDKRTGYVNSATVVMDGGWTIW